MKESIRIWMRSLAFYKNIKHHWKHFLAFLLSSFFVKWYKTTKTYESVEYFYFCLCDEVSTAKKMKRLRPTTNSMNVSLRCFFWISNCDEVGIISTKSISFVWQSFFSPFDAVMWNWRHKHSYVHIQNTTSTATNIGYVEKPLEWLQISITLCVFFGPNS